MLAGEVVRRRRCRPGSASEKLDHHRGSPSTVKVSSARSMATRCAATSSASAFSLWILAQRAIWFRFEPIRASSRVRSRSSSACATVQVRTRPSTGAPDSDSDNPTAAGLGVPLGPLRLAGSDLHPDFAPRARDAGLSSGGRRGLSPLASPCRGSRVAWPQRVGWLLLL